MKKVTPKSIKKRTMARKAAFLRAFGNNGSVTRSARLAGIDRTTHYEWLAEDAKYKAAFYLTSQMARDALVDYLVHRGRIGVFEPLIYKGNFCYAERKRVLCKLADGTTAFEDELPEDAKVTQRQTVTTRGEKLGVYKRNWRALWAAYVRMSEGCGGTGLSETGKNISVKFEDPG